MYRNRNLVHLYWCSLEKVTGDEFPDVRDELIKNRLVVMDDTEFEPFLHLTSEGSLAINHWFSYHNNPLCSLAILYLFDTLKHCKKTDFEKYKDLGYTTVAATTDWKGNIVLTQDGKNILEEWLNHISIV